MRLQRRSLSSLLLVLSMGAATVLACGSGDDGAAPGPGGGDPTVDPDGGAAARDGDGDGAEGPIVQKEFPLTTPSLGGYTLVDAFPDLVFDIPAAIAWPSGQPTPFVLERTGQIKRVEGGGKTARTVLDYGSQVHVAGEGGAVGMALHPQFGDGTGTKPYVYVWYNACEPSSACTASYSQRLQRYTWSSALNAFDPASVLTMIEEREFENVHNAGKLAFGPTDGFLYFGNGDDSQVANHQTITRGLFAGLFRIDVDADPAKSHAIPAGHTTDLSPFTRQGYGIPNDNPFVGAVANGLEEFYALGFRNPFSWSFDRKTGDLWLGDVGDSFREEVNHVVKGGNYQWPIKEGELANVTTGITQYAIGTPTPPVFSYSHAEIADLSSIFGGAVYRGASLPELEGKYVFTDWISNRVWALDLTRSPVTRTTLVDHQFKSQPMGIGQDNDGELYVLQYGPTRGEAETGGHVKKLARDPSGGALPRRLRETFLFSDVPSLTPAADLVPYDVSSPLWSDGASKKRWIRLPRGQKVTAEADGTLKIPTGTIFVKQFDLPDDLTVAGRSRHLETRVMLVGRDTTYGYTFRWNAAGTDATIVTDGEDETLTDAKTGATRRWHYPSFGECWSCHRNGWDDLAGTKRNDRYRILGFTAPQLAPEQRTQLVTRGVLDADLAQLPAALPQPSDPSKPLEERAIAYLAANCSPCHHENASYTGGGQTWLASPGAGDLAARGLDRTANNYPMTVRLGIPGGKLVARGNPGGSVLLGRIRSNDPDLRMPPLARNVVDTAGAALIEQWIGNLAP
jgi:glucose/arabinose dehydrogenase